MAKADLLNVDFPRAKARGKINTQKSSKNDYN